jgi:hypothetical protein
MKLRKRERTKVDLYRSQVCKHEIRSPICRVFVRGPWGSSRSMCMIKPELSVTVFHILDVESR